MATGRALVASLVLVALMLALSAWAWAQLPADASVPVHWGVSGEPDRFGSKAEGLLLLPLVTLAMAALFTVIPRIEPRRVNLAESRRPYVVVWLAVVGFMALLHVPVVMAALGRAVPVDRVVPAGVGLLFIAIGWVLPRIRSNFHFGVRTPWTLTSERSWESTHRLSGRLFTLLGAVMVVAVLVASGRLLFGLLVGGALLITVVATVHSYLVWRDDPDKQQQGR